MVLLGLNTTRPTSTITCVSLNCEFPGVPKYIFKVCVVVFNQEAVTVIYSNLNDTSFEVDVIWKS